MANVIASTANEGQGGTYGIVNVVMAEPVTGSFPAAGAFRRYASGDTIPSGFAQGDWPAGSFGFSAIVMDSVSFNDSAPSENDLYVEDADTIYATLRSDEGSKGFTLDTYDLSREAYMKLYGATQEATGTPTTSGGDNVYSEAWVVEPAKIPDLVKSVQIITRKFGDFPSKTFQWAKMKITVTKAGTIGKSGFPNLHLEFKQLANFDAQGVAQSGHRWKLTNQADYAAAGGTGWDVGE